MAADLTKMSTEEQKEYMLANPDWYKQYTEGENSWAAKNTDTSAATLTDYVGQLNALEQDAPDKSKFGDFTLDFREYNKFKAAKDYAEDAGLDFIRESTDKGTVGHEVLNLGLGKDARGYALTTAAASGLFDPKGKYGLGVELGRGTRGKVGKYSTVRSIKESNNFLDKYGEQIAQAALAVGLGGFGAAAGGAVAASGGLGAVGTGAASGAATGGLSAVGSGLINDNLSLEGVLKGAALGGISGGLGGMGKSNAFGKAYNSDNFASSALKGTTNSAVKQLIQDGELSVEDALKAGLIQMGTDTAKDIFEDAQTNRNLIKGVSTKDGSIMDPTTFKRISDSTDIHGLLGPTGALKKWFDWDVGRMPTKYLGDALGMVGLGGRPTVADHEELTKQAQADIDALSEQDLTVKEAGEQIRAIKEQYYRDTTQYDESTMDLTSERGEVPYKGTYEYNTVRPAGNSWWGGEGVAPISTGTFDYEADTSRTPISNTILSEEEFTPEDDPEFKKYMDQNLTADIGDEYLPETVSTDTPQEEYISEEELLKGHMPGEDELVFGGLQEGYDQVADPLANEDSELPAQEDIEEAVDDLPGISVDDLPAFKDIPTTEISESALPTSTSTTTEEGGGVPSPVKLPTRRRGSTEKDDADAFRLATILKIEGLPQNIAVAAMTRLKALLSKRETSRVEGDATLVLDPESGRYIKRVKQEDKETPKEDLIQQAIDEATA